MKRYLWISVILMLTLFSSCVKTEQADLIVHNATIISMDVQNNIHQAMAIKDGKILELGPEHEIMNRYLGDEVLDAKKKVVMPGIVDNHAYFIENAHLLANYDFRKYDDWDTLIKAMHANRTDSVLFGFGWTKNWFGEFGVPGLKELDSLFPDRAVFLKHRWGFGALVNSACIDLFDLKTEDASADGEDLIKLDDWKDQQIFSDLNKYYELGSTECFEQGIIASSNLGLQNEVFRTIKSFYENETQEMDLSIHLAYNEENFKFLIDYEDSIPNLDLLGMNLYMPIYIGDDQKSLKSRLFLLKENGKQVLFHTFTAYAFEQTLELAEEFLSEVNDLRWRIENAHLMKERHLPAFKKFTLIPGICPQQYQEDLEYPDSLIYFPLQSLFEQNRMISVGTSMPMTANNPWKTMSDLMRIEGHKLNNEQVLRSMTSWAALARRKEDQFGSLESNKDGSFIVLDKNPLKAGAEQMAEIEVLSTWVRGEQVFAN